ncbi:MAG TPA: hypothetical protein VLX91_01850 [Candidatus Acidoferrales bacterium]|nr:hypothetical protein [Candidatus Acidoferrales bacterium]
MRIISVNPGWRHTGIAVFRGSDLDDWRVKSIRHRTADEIYGIMTATLDDLAETYGVKVLAMKKLHPARSSRNLRELTTEVKRWAAKRGLVVRDFSIKEVESSFLSLGMLNKARLVEEVVARYPVLCSELEIGGRSHSPYSIRMFEAVALGMKCLSDLEKEKGRKIILTNHEKQ